MRSSESLDTFCINSEGRTYVDIVRLEIQLPDTLTPLGIMNSSMYLLLHHRIGKYAWCSVAEY